MPIKFLHNLFLVDSRKDVIRPVSILICDNKIFRVYHNVSVTKIIKNLRQNFSDIQIYNLNGYYVIPGFTDSHTHLLAHGIERQRIDLSKCLSLTECLEKLNSKKNDAIIFGVNWDESTWLKGRREQLNRRVLDRISRNKPVIMRRICGHFAVCNTKALEFFSSKWHIVDKKNGYLYEDAALYLNQIFRPSFDMYKKAIDIAMEEALSLGITSIHEITDLHGFDCYQQFKEKLRIRVAIYLQNGLKQVNICSLQSNFGNDFLKFAGVKIFMDGSIGARTAAINKCYKNSKNRGKLLISEKQLCTIIDFAENHSIQLMIHSIGDRSTDTVLKVFRKIGLKTNRLRHRIEHLEILNRRNIRKMANLGLIASMQPNFLRWQSLGNMYEKNLGLGYQQMNCFKRIKAAGIKLIFGSDCMPLGPINGIDHAINSPFDDVRLTPAEAIYLYTDAPSYATFDDDKKGKIEEGKFADLVVLNKNPLLKESYYDLKVLMVMVNGSFVYNATKS
ncbi:MAG: amidohydrolase family protein [bacterium]